jgi:CBS domain-containing protein
MFAEGEVSTLPVVDSEDSTRLVGVLTHHSLIIHYHQEIQKRSV